MFARGWETCPNQMFHYSYRSGTSTPMCYPKCEMEFPYQKSTTCTISAFERSRWRGGRFACYAPQVMPQGRAFNCDFRFSLIFLSPAKSIGCKRKRIQFP